MHIETTSLPGVMLIKPQLFHDARGRFFESFQENRYAQHGIQLKFVQDNISYSKKGTLRGLHYQLQHPQGKLVSVLQGKVFDVAVDIRLGSPTFGHSFGCELSYENHHQLYVPPGFAHGFYVLSEDVCFHYKCTDYYHPKDEQGIAWNDPALNIAWPEIAEPVLSEKDKLYVALRDTPIDHLPKI
jgi:dTDP-4-dehydrorhamnose 3,5-epimerase